MALAADHSTDTVLNARADARAQGGQVERLDAVPTGFVEPVLSGRRRPGHPDVGRDGRSRGATPTRSSPAARGSGSRTRPVTPAPTSSSTTRSSRPSGSTSPTPRRSRGRPTSVPATRCSPVTAACSRRSSTTPRAGTTRSAERAPTAWNAQQLRRPRCPRGPHPPAVTSSSRRPPSTGSGRRDLPPSGLVLPGSPGRRGRELRLVRLGSGAGTYGRARGRAAASRADRQRAAPARPTSGLRRRAAARARLA